MFLSAPLRDEGYRCNASTVHDGSSSPGPSLGQTFLVSTVQLAISISNVGGVQDDVGVSALCVLWHSRERCQHQRSSTRLRCQVGHTWSSGGLSVWRLWTRSPASSELLLPGRYDVRHTCLSHWRLSCGFDDRLIWLFLLFEVDMMFAEGSAQTCLFPVLSDIDYLQLADLPLSLAVRHGIHETEFDPRAAIVQRFGGRWGVNILLYTKKLLSCACRRTFTGHQLATRCLLAVS